MTAKIRGWETLGFILLAGFSYRVRVRVEARRVANERAGIKRVPNRWEETMRRVGYAAVLVLMGLLSVLPTFAEPKTGTLCVIPDPPGCCILVTVPFDLKTLMFRIDNGNKTPWPQKMGFKVEGLSLGEKHLVVVYSGGKPIQSFRFRFTDYNETELCLLFDGYGGPDLRPMSKLCHCK